MCKQLIVCLSFSFVLWTACKPSRPTEAASPKNVMLQVFEVIDCKTPYTIRMSLRADKTKTYCLANEVVVDQADVTHAEATRVESGGSRLLLFFTSKAGERIRGTTERIMKEHPDPNDPGRMALVVDGTLIEAAALREPLHDQIQIEGAFSFEEATQIAKSLNAMPRPQPSTSNGQK